MTTAEKEKKTKASDAATEAPDLVAVLMGALEEAIGQPGETRPNKSGTYSRLIVGGKAFAYLFPPRPNGVLLKIPKQLIGVEKDLPKGHRFKRVGWGLTRTVATPAEATAAAAALAVAAAATKEKAAA